MVVVAAMFGSVKVTSLTGPPTATSTVYDRDEPNVCCACITHITIRHHHICPMVCSALHDCVVLRHYDRLRWLHHGNPKSQFP
jgi:hypothetical protein